MTRQQPNTQFERRGNQQRVSAGVLAPVFGALILLLVLEAMLYAAAASHIFMYHGLFQSPAWFLVARGLGWYVLWRTYRRRRNYLTSWVGEYFNRAIEILWLWSLLIILPLGLTIWAMIGQGFIPPQTAPDFEEVQYAVAMGTVIGASATYLLLAVTWVVTGLRVWLNIYDLRPRRSVDKFPSMPGAET